MQAAGRGAFGSDSGRIRPGTARFIPGLADHSALGPLHRTVRKVRRTVGRTEPPLPVCDYVYD